MDPKAHPPSVAASATEHKIEEILAIARDAYGSDPDRLHRIIADVRGLYHGEWPEYEPCQAPYHNFDHAVDAALTVARIIVGWNRAHPGDAFDEEQFLLAVTAGFFHDAGYIKDRGDLEGSGGKHTFTHVQRGMEMARLYLLQKGWPKEEVETVVKMISLTDYRHQPDPVELFPDPKERRLAGILPTADLVAQMADSEYLHRLDDLYLEFKEVYDQEGVKKLRTSGTQVFRSAGEIRAGVSRFYREFVAPRLEQFGRMDRYLAAYFGEGRNPYHENIIANLSAQLLDSEGTWKKLGEILQDLGLVTEEEIAKALAAQEKESPASRAGEDLAAMVRQCLLPWFHTRGSGVSLGDVLMDKGVLSPQALARGLIQQILPDALLDQLSASELKTLLKIAVLLQNICRGPWVLGQVMAEIDTLLNAEASSIMLAKPGSEEMLISLPTGPRQQELSGQAISVDKGLAGWVFRNARPAMVADVASDLRFNGSVDRRFGFATRSLVAAPLFVNGRCIGVVEAVNKRSGEFDAHDLHLLVLLANMISTSFVTVICQMGAS